MDERTECLGTANASPHTGAGTVYGWSSLEAILRSEGTFGESPDPVWKSKFRSAPIRGKPGPFRRRFLDARRGETDRLRRVQLAEEVGPFEKTPGLRAQWLISAQARPVLRVRVHVTTAPEKITAAPLTHATGSAPWAPTSRTFRLAFFWTQRARRRRRVGGVSSTGVERRLHSGERYDAALAQTHTHTACSSTSSGPALIP